MGTVGTPAQADATMADAVDETVGAGNGDILPIEDGATRVQRADGDRLANLEHVGVAPCIVDCLLLECQIGGHTVPSGIGLLPNGG